MDSTEVARILSKESREGRLDLSVFIHLVNTLLDSKAAPIHDPRVWLSAVNLPEPLQSVPAADQIKKIIENWDTLAEK